MSTRQRTSVATRPLRAAIYCRISLAVLGDTTKVDDQERQCREVCARRGWTVVAVHVDNSKSAWQRSRRRPGWDALLAGVEAGRYDAIVTYWGDRLVRQPRDLEDLLDLAEGRGLRLASVTGHYDLDNPDHRMMMRWEVARACNESDTISRRMKNGAARRAEAGRTRTGGLRPYAFARDNHTIIEGEAAVVRECAGRVLAGESIGSICRDLNARGVPTSTGGAWSHGTLAKMLVRPRYAGLVELNGEIVGEAVFKPILDRETWEAVRAILTTKAERFDYVTNARRYLLSGIATCGTCDHPLAIRHNTRAESLRGYGCVNPDCERKVHRSVAHLDAFVIGAVLRLLGDRRVVERLTRPRRGSTSAAELAALEARRRRAALEFADDPLMTPELLRLTLARLDERIAAARAALGEERAAHVLDGLAGVDRAGWDALPLDRRRAIVRELFTAVRVLATGRRGPGFDPDSVVLVPRRR